jgi:hypothetical protein
MIISKEVEKNKPYLEFTSIKPLPDTYLHSIDEIYLICGTMDSCKTYSIMKYLLICDRLFEKAYYNYVIFTNTSDKLHKT